MRTILITGSNGLLGQKLINKLREDSEVNLVATSKGANRISASAGYEYHDLDITKQEEVEAIFNLYKPHVVINTAAMTNVDACESDKEGCWKLNVTAVEYLIKAAESHRSHLIHLSTDFIFDGESGPYKEDDTPNPLSYYGESKLAAEQLIGKAKTKWAIARTIIVYGVAENMSRSNIVLWAKGALEKGESLNIVNDQFRSPTLAEDLADGCILIAEKEAEGIFHLSGKDLMSIVDLVRKVAHFFSLDESTIQEISSTSLNQAAKRPPKTGFVISKAINELGFKPHSFEGGLEMISKQIKA